MGIIKREEGKEASKMQQTLLTLTNLALATAASLDLKQVAVPRLRAASGDANENEAFQQRIQCWDRTGQNGDSVIATDYMPYISYHNMDNKIESCVFNGIWILYGDEVYNGGNPLSHNWWAYGENYASDTPANFRNEASSLRYSGHHGLPPLPGQRHLLRGRRVLCQGQVLPRQHERDQQISQRGKRLFRRSLKSLHANSLISFRNIFNSLSTKNKR